MTTRELTSTLFPDSTSISQLFRALKQVIAAWISARRYRQLDFRQLSEDEITPAIKAKLELVRNAPDSDFVNL